MLLSLIILIASLSAVLYGASKMTDGAAAMALRMKISPMMVGLTIVAMGTSAPELCVSLVSAIGGNADIAVGNVVGSNIFNNLMIVGAVVLVAPQTVSRQTVWRDIPFCVLGSAMLLLMLLPGEISEGCGLLSEGCGLLSEGCGLLSEGCGTITRLESLALCSVFALFLWLTIRGARKNPTTPDPQSPDAPAIPKALLQICLGLACLIIGADYFVEAATDIAHRLNVSDAIIGLTIVGAGTSLPELATSVVAARKGQGEMAIGNVIGTNVFNVFMILGVTGLICPMTPRDISLTTIIILIAAATLFWLFSFTKYKLERWEGAVLLLCCAAYMLWLVL